MARVSERVTENDIPQFNIIFLNNVKPLQGWENNQVTYRESQGFSLRE